MPSKAEVMWVSGEGRNANLRSRDKIKRTLKNFFYKYYTQEKLEELITALSPKDKLAFAAMIAPYVTKKESEVAEVNNAEKIEELKTILLQAIKSNTHEIQTIE